MQLQGKKKGGRGEKRALVTINKQEHEQHIIIYINLKVHTTVHQTKTKANQFKLS